MSPVQKATCGKEETMHQHLNTLYQGQSLTRDAARDAFGQVVRGEVDPIVLALSLIHI